MMKQLKKALAFLLVPAFAMLPLASCSAAEKHEYTLPTTVTVTRDGGSTTVYTFSYDGNEVTMEEDGVIQSIDACDDAGVRLLHCAYEAGEWRSKLTYKYDRNGRLVRHVHEDAYKGYSTEYEFTYDSEGRELETVAKPMNGDPPHKTVYEYGENSKKEIVYNPDGSVSSVTVSTYDEAGRITEQALSHGNGESHPQATWEYNENGLLARQCVLDTSGGIFCETKYTYAADGSYTATDYSGRGEPYSQTDYRADGKILEERNYSDGLGSTATVITYTYDANGAPSCVVKSRDEAVWERSEVTGTCTLSLTEDAYRFLVSIIGRNAFQIYS